MRNVSKGMMHTSKTSISTEIWARSDVNADVCLSSDATFTRMQEITDLSSRWSAGANIHWVGQTNIMKPAK